MSEQGPRAAVKANIEWNDGFSVSVQEIDEQHRQIMEAISNLSHKLPEGSLGPLLVAIDELVRVSSHHMKVEEELMLKFHFPEYKDHHMRHNEITGNYVSSESRQKRVC